MSPLLLLSIVLQVACCVHVVRSGRPLYWIFILLLFSYIGVLVYTIVAVLPDLQNSQSSRARRRKKESRVEQFRHKRDAERLLQTIDDPEYRQHLAAQSLEQGDYEAAEELYRQYLSGASATDPYLMLGLAKAQYGYGNPQGARDTLDRLIAANPQFRSTEGHLLYARSVEDVGDIEAALHEYDAVVQDYPGEEARARYALLLKRIGRQAQAVAQFRHIIERTEAESSDYRQAQRDWIELARRELATLA